jgi:hypothetical protein
MSEQNLTPETPTVTAAETVATPAPTTAPAPLPSLSPAFATTPKRGGTRKMPKEPSTLLAYAIEQGGRIELSPDTVKELVSRGLPERRISNAAYGIRKCFGKDVKTERSGRTVTAYVVTL